MRNLFTDEKNLTSSKIAALGLSDLERSRALAALAKAEALVGLFVAVSQFFCTGPRRVQTRPNFKLQK